MKSLKKLMAVILVLVLAFSMSITALAAPPVATSAAVSGSTLTITFDAALSTEAANTPDPTDFDVTIDSNPGPAVTNVAIAGSTVTLTLDTAIPNGTDDVEVEYTPGTNPLYNVAETDGVAAFTLAATVPGAGATMPGPGEIVGGGQVPGLVIGQDEFLGGVVPTSIAFTFIIDPLGLLDLEYGDTHDPDGPTTNVVTFVDTISGNPVETTYWAHNTSSVDMILAVELAVTNYDGDAVPYEINVVSNEAAVTADDQRNVLLWMEPHVTVETEQPSDLAVSFDGPGYVIAFGEYGSPTVVHYRLDSIDSQLVITSTSPNITADRVPVNASDLNGTAFRFGGVFNEDAAWGNANEDIGLSVRFVSNPINAAATGLEYATVGTGADEVEIEGLLAAGTAILSGLNASAPTFIEMPELNSRLGFAQSTITVPSATWSMATFFYGGLTVTSMTVDGFLMTEGTHWAAPEHRREANEFAFFIPSPGSNRLVVVTLSDGSTHSVRLNIT